MIFTPEKYTIDDRPGLPFIDPAEIEGMLAGAKPDRESVERIIQKSLNKERLSMQDVAVLVNSTDPALIELIKQGAKTLKQKVYGNRIVLFAPLYIGNKCSNNCKYCGFRSSNKHAVRKTLNHAEMIKNVEALEENGQKRLILVYGEHRDYSPEFIAETVRTVYQVKKGNGEIRRVNINAAPLDVEGFKIVKDSGIGTYQVFQETYHPDAYNKYHTGGKKADYKFRLNSLDRAFEAGIDDVGIGALFGLHDWRFEVMGLVRHVNHLEACFNVGPHTISFPRLQDASDIAVDKEFLVSDEEFVRLVAILRLAVPYTGMILTARESMLVRNEVLQFGCSQIDAGTKIELGAYAEEFTNAQNLDKEQFQISDNRSLGEIIDELLEGDFLPSFCTACYRRGRTGEHFMEFSVPGFIKRCCTPNAMLTLAEYLMDYASEATKKKGWAVIQNNVDKLNDVKQKEELLLRIEKVKAGERDLHF